MIAQRVLCIAMAAGAILLTPSPAVSRWSPVKPIARCYENGPLPALRSGTRVFIQVGLEEDRGRSAQGELIRIRFATGSLLVVAKNIHGLSGPVLVPGDKPVTLRATRLICAYDASIKLPALFKNVKPDIVIS